MVWEAFWGSLGLLLGALGGPLGVSWELLRVSGSTKEGLLSRLGALLGLVCSRLAAGDGLGSVVESIWLVFGAPKRLLGSVLAPVKTISTIKTASPSFDTFCFFALVVVVVSD